jgi:molybdenum cofactor cytidylyltransferase
VSAAGLILAAGESRRMGSPKALLDYRGATFLDTLIGLFAARCSQVIVVLGAAAEEIRAGVRRPATFVVNPDYARGQITSMQYGLRVAPPEAEGVLFTLVDHPAVALGTIDALVGALKRENQMPPGMAAWQAGGPLHKLCVPRYRGRRGHPVWIAGQLIPEFLALPESGAARDVVQRHASETLFLDLDDPGIVADIDDPAAYLSLVGAQR